MNRVPDSNGTDLPSFGSDMPSKELLARLRVAAPFSVISNEPISGRNRMSIAEMEQSNDSRLPGRNPRGIDPVNTYGCLAGLASTVGRTPP